MVPYLQRKMCLDWLQYLVLFRFNIIVLFVRYSILIDIRYLKLDYLHNLWDGNLLHSHQRAYCLFNLFTDHPTTFQKKKTIICNFTGNNQLFCDFTEKTDTTWLKFSTCRTSCTPATRGLPRSHSSRYSCHSFT